MAEVNYELAFYGELAPGHGLEQTKQQIAQLFKANAEQIERMFTGKRIVIRNKLDLATGRKYVLAMAKRGAVCQLEQMGQPGVEVKSEPPQESSTPPAAQGELAESSVAKDPHGGMIEQESEPASTPASEQEIAAKPALTGAAEEESLIPGDRLQVAGDKVDEILADAHMGVAPVGSRLAPEAKENQIAEPDISAMSLAPVGADLGEKEEKPTPIVPDTSHLSLKE